MELESIEPKRLYESQFESVGVKHLLFMRAIATVFVVWVVVFGILLESPAAEYLIYATHWSAILSMIYFLFVVHRTYLHMEGAELMRGDVWMYIACETTVPIGLTIVAMYWLVIFKGHYDSQNEAVNSIQNHGAICVLLLLDLILTRVVFFYKHVMFPIAFFIAYVPFNAAFSLVHFPVYSVMTWRSIGTLFVVIAALIAIVIFSSSISAITQKFRREVQTVPDPNIQMMAGPAPIDVVV